MEGPNDFKEVVCECGNDRFYPQVQIRIYPHGSFSSNDWHFECANCHIVVNQWGEKITKE